SDAHQQKVMSCPDRHIPSGSILIDENGDAATKATPEKELSPIVSVGNRIPTTNFQIEANLIREHCHSPLSAHQNRQSAAPASYGRVEVNRMSNLQTKMAFVAVMGIVALLPNFALAQSPTTATQSDQPNRVSIVYGQPNNPAFAQLYDLLRERRALERIQ